MKHLSTIIALILTFAHIGAAQEITVQAPQSVYVGDNFTVRFVVNDQAKDFRGPDFKGFSLRAGPGTSTSSSTSFINGQMSHSVQTTFTYTLKADVEGSFTVGSASCTAGGKQLSSKPFSIKVEKLSQQAQQQRAQQQQQRDTWAGQQQPAATQIDENILFARASISNSNPYQGEQVIITYKIYTQVQVSQFAIDKLPRNRGFWAEDLTDDRQVKQYTETIGDRQYKVAEIRRGALFAQESGKLTIEPLDLNVLAMVQRQRRRTGSIWDLFDDPFFNPSQAIEKPLSTNRINVNVKPLPAAPDGFGGAVGHFDVKGGINYDQVKANEALTYRITVSGSGNLMLIDAPKPQFPAVFEVYDPQIDDNIRKSESGISGSRTFEWVLIPRSQGEYTIPAFRFVYFDPTTGQYVTKQIEAQNVEVTKGDSRISSHSKDNVQLLANDINYIHPTTRLHRLKEQEHAGWPFWLSAALILLASVGSTLYFKRKWKNEGDVAGMRMKRATQIARKRLRHAESWLDTNRVDPFYEEIYKAIWGCLSDKYNIPLSQLSRDSVSERLAERQVEASQQEAIMKLLQDVDLARFAPGDAHSQMQNIYDEALNMIASLS